MLGASLKIAAIALLGTGLVVSSEAITQEQSDFGVTDLNNNGEIDREEYHRRMMDTMYFADDDSDGALTMEELPETDPATFRAADRDGDGRLSSSEFMDSRFSDFDEADLDDSGTLSPAEVDAFR